MYVENLSSSFTKRMNCCSSYSICPQQGGSVLSHFPSWTLCDIHQSLTVVRHTHFTGQLILIRVCQFNLTSNRPMDTFVKISLTFSFPICSLHQSKDWGVFFFSLQNETFPQKKKTLTFGERHRNRVRVGGKKRHWHWFSVLAAGL